VAYEFKLPDLGEGLTEGEIARWLVEEGQDIAEDAPLVEIATDKTTVEIPSPAGGTVSRILVPEGEVVPVGTVLVVIGGDGSTPQPEKSSTKPAARAEEKVRATPLVRKVAAELGVDLAGLSGSGAQGRITEEDVRAASGAKTTEGERIQLHGIRRQMFEHLTRAHREIPAVTWVEECDFSDVDLKRLVPFVLSAVVESLREFPELNARVEGGELVLLDRYDIGVAVQTEQGLVVPVVKDAGALTLEQIGARLDDLTRRARDGNLERSDVSGGSFTISNHGVSGSLLAAPIILHQGQAAILGVGKLEKRVVVRTVNGRDAMLIHPMAYVTLTIDHRVVDGHQTNAWLSRFVELLETWPAA